MPDLSRYLTAASLLRPDTIVESAWHEHGPFAFFLVEVLRPRRFVELGTHNGFSYFCFCQAVQLLASDTSCYAIDTWKGDVHAGFYGEEAFESVSAINDRYGEFSSLVRSTFSEAAPHFADGSIDLLHIDGRHFYEDVKDDFETWLPKMSRQGIVLLHDTNVRERQFGVSRLFQELGERFRTFEFMHGHGLGILAVGETPLALAPLFGASLDEQAFIRMLYARLGAAIPAAWGQKQLQTTMRTLTDRNAMLEADALRRARWWRFAERR